MNTRLRTLGATLTILGLIFVAGGVFTFFKVKAGAASLEAFSAAQGVTLSYNDEGQLIDRGSTEGADAILALLKDDWKYPVNMSELDPNDPLVNTGTEYMYQMATVTYHTLHGTATVTLAEDADDVEYDGVTYQAGDTVEFVNEGWYWTGFDRTDPIEGPARGQIWSGTAHAIIAELGVGSVTASTLQMGYGIAGLITGIGLTVILTGVGLVWVAQAGTTGAMATEAKPKAGSRAAPKPKK
jgi:hypothetical protein